MENDQRAALAVGDLAVPEPAPELGRANLTAIEVGELPHGVELRRADARVDHLPQLDARGLDLPGQLAVLTEERVLLRVVLLAGCNPLEGGSERNLGDDAVVDPGGAIAAGHAVGDFASDLISGPVPAIGPRLVGLALETDHQAALLALFFRDWADVASRQFPRAARQEALLLEAVLSAVADRRLHERGLEGDVDVRGRRVAAVGAG